VFFLSRIIPHYLARKSPYLLWWTLGVATFGAGTLTESKCDFRLERMEHQDLVYRRRLAGPAIPGAGDDLSPDEQTVCRYLGAAVPRRSSWLPPSASCFRRSRFPRALDYRLNGKVFGWQWVRAFSPLLKSLCLCFPVRRCRLFGDPVFRRREWPTRFLGNIFIAVARCFRASGNVHAASAMSRSCTLRNSSAGFNYFGYYMMKGSHLVPARQPAALRRLRPGS